MANGLYALINGILKVGIILNSGSYTGNATVNRAIPHGLGVTPKIVLLTQVSAAYDNLWRILSGYAMIWFSQASSKGIQVVTAPDATNFYVGNSAYYGQSANGSGVSMFWVALG